MGADEEGSKKFEKGGDDDCSKGPVEKRRIRDPLWCLLFIAHFGLFWALGLMASQKGAPQRMVNGKDFMGDVCGVPAATESGLNEYGYDLTEYPVVMYTLNMTSVQKKIADGMGLGMAGSMDPAALMSGLEADPAGKISSMIGGPNDLISELMAYFHPVCVKSCSMVDADGNEDTPRPSLWEGEGHYSDLETQLWKATVKEAFKGRAYAAEDCPYPGKFCASVKSLFPIVEVAEVAGYCVPTISSAVGVASELSSDVANAIPSNFTDQATGSFNDAVSDVVTVWYTFIFMGVVAVVIGMVYLVLMRLVIKILVWASLLAVGLIFLVGALLVYFKAYQCAGVSLTETGTSMAMSLTPQQECPVAGFSIASETQRTAMAVFACALLGIFALYALCICCNRNRIKLAIALNQVAAKFVAQQPSVLLVPPVQILIVFCYFGIWAVLTTFVVTDANQIIADAVAQETNLEYTHLEAFGVPESLTSALTTLSEGSTESSGVKGACWENGFYPVSYSEDAEGFAMRKVFTEGENEGQFVYKCQMPATIWTYQFWYALFHILWMNAFMVALGQCTIAGAVAYWYFKPNNEKTAFGCRGGTVMKGLKNSLLYHLGSLALGSFIIAVIQLVKYYLMYLAKQAEKQHNKVLSLIFKCLGYIVWCVEKCMKFLNKNAYIQIALLGKKFCAAAKDAFLLILRNALRIMAATLIAPVIHLFGFVTITVGTTFLGYVMLINVFPDEISSPFVICLFYLMIGYMVGKLVMNVFGLAVDTTLQCFVADEEINGEAGDHTPEELKQFLPTIEGKKFSLCPCCSKAKVAPTGGEGGEKQGGD